MFAKKNEVLSDDAMTHSENMKGILILKQDIAMDRV
jgi:hypothetical protein